MSWLLFEWVVLPPGLLLSLMLASGQKHAMKAAGYALAAPFSVGALKMSLAVFMVAFTGTCSVLQYLSATRSAARLASVKAIPMMGNDPSYEEKQVFYSERNFYLSLLALSLWAFAWRLKVLNGRRQLVPPPEVAARKGAPRPVLFRGAFALLGVAALVVADIPLCRLDYNLQLTIWVTPKKNSLLESDVGVRCAGVMAAQAGQECADFCREARNLAQLRLDTILSARKWHPGGRVAAQLFDEARGVEQGSGRLDQLFAKKTCSQVLQSVDKSNMTVNILCYFFTGVSLILAMVAFTAVADEADYDNLHQD